MMMRWGDLAKLANPDKEAMTASLSSPSLRAAMSGRTKLRAGGALECRATEEGGVCGDCPTPRLPPAQSQSLSLLLAEGVCTNTAETSTSEELVDYSCSIM